MEDGASYGINSNTYNFEKKMKYSLLFAIYITHSTYGRCKCVFTKRKHAIEFHSSR